MTLSEAQVREILSHYDLGDAKALRRLRDGYHSTNYALTTDQGVYALRILHDAERDVAYTMRVYEYLVSRGIRTARPVRTKDHAPYLTDGNRSVAILTFLEGEHGTRSRRYLSTYGRELGKVQAALAEAPLQGRDEAGALPWLRSHLGYLPDDRYVRRQYEELEEELASLPLEGYTRAIINSDCQESDFLFRDGRFVGILDFGDAHPDYVLYDIATMMMYLRIYPRRRGADFLRFILPYLAEFPLPTEEFAGLHAFLKTRFIIQVVYHSWRHTEGLTQGLGGIEDNLGGVRRGVDKLRRLDKVPERFHLKVLERGRSGLLSRTGGFGGYGRRTRPSS